MTEIDASRALAARVAPRAQIRDVRLLDAEAHLTEAPSGDRLGYNLQIDSDFDWDPEDDAFIVTCAYEVSLFERPDEAIAHRSGVDNESTYGSDRGAERQESESDPPSFATIRFRMLGLFSVQMREDDAALSRDEVGAYASTTGRFALYPFAREYVRDMSSRMGIPPLTLGVAVLPVTRAEVDNSSRIVD